MITYVYSDNHMCKYILCTYIYIYHIYVYECQYILFIYLYIIYTCVYNHLQQMDMIWISTTMLKLPTCHLNTVKIQALRRSSSSWRHPSSVGHGLRYSMWFCVLNLGGVTNNSFMLGIVRVLSLDIVTILTYVYTIIIYIYICIHITQMGYIQNDEGIEDRSNNMGDVMLTVRPQVIVYALNVSAWCSMTCTLW